MTFCWVVIAACNSLGSLYVCVYVCMCVCVYVCMYACMYVCMCDCCCHCPRGNWWGSQGMGVVSNSWFDRVLLSNTCPVSTLMLTDVQAPYLGTPAVPRSSPYIYTNILQRRRSGDFLAGSPFPGPPFWGRRSDLAGSPEATQSNKATQHHIKHNKQWYCYRHYIIKLYHI